MDDRIGMKGLIFDDYTVRICSIVYMQSEGFKKDVYLFENIKNIGQERIQSLVGIFIIHPNKETIRKLNSILKQPAFKEYHICMG